MLLKFLFCDNYRFTCSCRNNTEKYYVPFTQFLLMVMVISFKTTVSTISPPGYWHCYSQDAEHFHHHKGPSSCPFLATPTSLPSSPPLPPPTHLLPLATTNLFSISIILSFQERYTNGSVKNVTFCFFDCWFFFSI